MNHETENLLKDPTMTWFTGEVVHDIIFAMGLLFLALHCLGYILHRHLHTAKKGKPMNDSAEQHHPGHGHSPGTRVGVILRCSQFEVLSLGYGTYDGEFHPPGAPPEVRNPRITLDTGEQVWGFQVWWSPAEDYDRHIARDHPFAEVKVVKSPFNNPFSTEGMTLQ